MKTAFSLFLAFPSTTAFVIFGNRLVSAVPVTNGVVTLVNKCIVRHFVGSNVGTDLLKVPVSQRVEFDETSTVDFDDGDGSTVALLASTAASDDGFHVQFFISTASRFDFDKIIVGIFVGFPKLLAMLAFEVGNGIAVYWLVHLKRDIVSLNAALSEVQCFLEVIKCIQEDERDDVVFLTLNADLVDHIESNQTWRFCIN